MQNKILDYEFEHTYLSKTGIYNLNKVGFIVGRFQPFHKGHKAFIENVLKEVDELVVFIGSVQESRTELNPFTFEERSVMIKSVFKTGVTTIPLPDYTSNDAWVQHIYKALTPFESTNTVVFCRVDKDEETQLSNNLFNKFETLQVPLQLHISATDIRKQLFEESVSPYSILEIPLTVSTIIYNLNLCLKNKKLNYIV